jgi:hypothetical protein
MKALLIFAVALAVVGAILAIALPDLSTLATAGVAALLAAGLTSIIVAVRTRE